MVTKENIAQTIFSAIDEINEDLSQEQRLEKDLDTILLGKAGKLDSLGLVNLIVATEQRLEDEFGLTVTLADEKAMSQKNSPFKTIGTLADYVSRLAGENGHE